MILSCDDGDYFESCDFGGTGDSGGNGNSDGNVDSSISGNSVLFCGRWNEKFNSFLDDAVP